MSLVDFAVVNVSLSNANGPQGPGLTTPLIAAYHNHYADRVRLYSTGTMLTQMVLDGFSTAEPAYKAASKVCGALAKPATCCIGRRALAPHQTLVLTCLDGTVNDSYDFQIVGSTGVSTTVHYQNVAAQGSEIVGSALTGTVAVVFGSTTVTFSTAQTLTAGEFLTFASQAGVPYAVAVASTGTTGTLSTPYTGTSNASTTTAAGGTTLVTNGSTAVTFSAAQTFAQGDLLYFSSQPGIPYALAAPVASSTSGTLTAAYAGTTAAATPTTHLAAITVTFHTITGSATVASSATPVGQVAAGDSMIFGSQLTTVYTVASVSAAGVVLTVPYAGAGASTDYAADVCTAGTAATAIAATLKQIASYAGLIGAVSVAGAAITISRVDGNLTDILGWLANGFTSLSLQDTTADPGIAIDLAAMQAANGGAFYGVILDSNSAAELEGAAVWAEATGVGGKILAGNNSDVGNTTVATTTDLFSVTHSLTYKRSFLQHNNQELLSYGGASILSYFLSQVPGSYNPAFKSEPGVPADSDTTLPEGLALALNTMTASAPGPGGKFGNYYKSQGGQPYLFPGCAPGGQFIDLTIGIDDLTIAMQVAVITYLAGLPKVPFDDFGLQGLATVIRGVLVSRSAKPYGLILPDGQDPLRPIQVNVPAAASYTSAQRAARIATGITWSAGLQGAVDGAVITGTLNP